MFGDLAYIAAFFAAAALLVAHHNATFPPGAW